LITNPGTYAPESGLTMQHPPQDHPFYDPLVGISKKKIVQHLQAQGYRVVFAGDGPPDFEPATIADTVFAKKVLLDMCQKAGIATQPFENYQDIYAFFKEALAYEKC